MVGICEKNAQGKNAFDDMVGETHEVRRREKQRRSWMKNYEEDLKKMSVTKG
jgi:hypothetical protein